MPRRAPFHDITNVVNSHSLTKGKQAQKNLGSGDHPITGTKRSINPSGISIQSTTPSVGHVTLPMDVSEHKRYRDRERYLRMTPEQRAAYLQRNREYKRRRKIPVEVSSNVQSGSQTSNCTNLRTQTTTLANTRTEACNESTGTGQHKRTAAFLDKGSGHKRRIISNGASCISTGKETHEHVVANDHEDHDSTIYVPNGCFPALEDESGQSGYMTEDDDEDDESYIFTGHDLSNSSHGTKTTRAHIKGTLQSSTDLPKHQCQQLRMLEMRGGGWRSFERGELFLHFDKLKFQNINTFRTVPGFTRVSNRLLVSHGPLSSSKFSAGGASIYCCRPKGEQRLLPKR